MKEVLEPSSHPAEQLDAGTATQDLDTINRSERQAWKRNVLAVAIGVPVAASLVAAPATYHLHEEISIMASTPTDTESFIQDALIDAGFTDGKSIWVNCEPPGEYDNPVDYPTRGYVKSMRIFGTIPVMHIRQDLCDAVIGYAASTDKGAVLPEQIQGLQVVLHEAAHISTDSGDEQMVECLAFQQIPQLAKELGATPEQAAHAQVQNFDDYHLLREDYKSVDCHDGGPYDLDRQAAGLFPFPIA